MDIFTASVTAVILLMKVDKQDVSFLCFIVYFDFDSLRKTFVNFFLRRSTFYVYYDIILLVYPNIG